MIKDKTLKKKRDPPSKITHNTRDPMEVSSHSMIGNNAVDRNILLLKISCKSFHGLTYTRSLYIYTYTIYTIYIFEGGDVLEEPTCSRSKVIKYR